MRIETGRRVVDVMPDAGSGRLEPADHAAPEARDRALPAPRIVDDAHLVEGRAEHGGMRHLAAEAAAHAALVHARDRILAQGVPALPEGERRTAVEAHAGLVAGADVRVHAEARSLDARPRLELGGDLWLHATLALELALGAGDDDLEPAGRRGHGLSDRL